MLLRHGNLLLMRQKRINLNTSSTLKNINVYVLLETVMSWPRASSEQVSFSVLHTQHLI